MVAPAAAGWTAGIEGLQIGVVKKLDANPDGEPMIQVSVPILEAEAPGVWARLAKLHATDGTGAFFVPEIGDEVVLGFLANDPSHPIVLGSLYNGVDHPPPIGPSALVDDVPKHRAEIPLALQRDNGRKPPKN